MSEQEVINSHVLIYIYIYIYIIFFYLFSIIKINIIIFFSLCFRKIMKHKLKKIDLIS